MGRKNWPGAKNVQQGARGTPKYVSEDGRRVGVPQIRGDTFFDDGGIDQTGKQKVDKGTGWAPVAKGVSKKWPSKGVRDDVLDV